MNPLLDIENLRLERDSREIFSIEKLVVERGDTLAIVGPNGAGKTSLLLTLALLQDPTEGAIKFDGQIAQKSNALSLRRRMAVVFQESLLLNATVMSNLTTALRIRGASRKEAKMKAEKWLDRFGILPLARQPARFLSGGEAQRTSLARAFALEPELLFLDEPFAALDYPTCNALLNDLGELLRDMKMTTLFVTHDYTEIPYIADRAAVMYDRKIMKIGSIKEVFGERIMNRKACIPWEIPES